jgi:hypothetical protein
VLFLARRLDALLAEARAALGAYVGADPDNLVFVPNATAGLNVAACPLELEPGRRGALHRSRVGLARPHLGARLRRLRRAVRAHTHSTSREECGRDRRRNLGGRVGPADTRTLPQPPHVHDSHETSGRGAVSTRSSGRDPNNRRRRACTWASPAEPARAGPRLLRGQLPQVAVPFLQRASGATAPTTVSRRRPCP